MQDSSLRNSVNHTANMTDGHDTIDRTHIHTQRKRKKKLKEGRKKESIPLTTHFVWIRNSRAELEL